MNITKQLLTEQAWSLQDSLNRCIETENIKKMASRSIPLRIDRLHSLQGRAYSRYLRRLKRLWG